MSIQYCKRCLNTSTRPNATFTDDGLCYPCATYTDPVDIDWEGRDDDLEKVVAFAKANNKSGYDCIVGVSGGKDSTRQALWIKEKTGLKPLLVSMNYPPYQISQIGVDNLSNLISLGFDCIQISCSPDIWQKAMKHAFFSFGNWAKPTEFALFASVPRVAVAYQIPLIWWGESAATLLGDMGVLGKNASDGNRLKYSNTLAGGDITWLTSFGFKKNEILQYIYPSDDDISKASLRIVFMDYFLKDFTVTANGSYAALRGLSSRKPNPTIEPDYTGMSQLDEDFFNINMHIRYLKFGFGRASDVVNMEIRNGRMTRQDAIEIVENYDGNYNAEILERFCCYIKITKQEFWLLVDKYVNTALFDKISEGHYMPKFKVGVSL